MNRRGLLKSVAAGLVLGIASRFALGTTPRVAPEPWYIEGHGFYSSGRWRVGQRLTIHPLGEGHYGYTNDLGLHRVVDVSAERGLGIVRIEDA